MIIINWNDRWRLRAEELQWVLEKRVGTRKKRHGKGVEPNWKGVRYYQDPLRALDYLTEHDIRTIGGEYPASVFKPLILGMNRIEERIEGVRYQFKDHLKAVAGGAKVLKDKERSIPTPANENALALKKKGEG